MPVPARFLSRSRRCDDRRRHPIAITATGRAALATALPYWRAAQARMADSLGRSRWWRLLGDLRDTAALTQAQ